MISLPQSVTATLDINTSQKWRGNIPNSIGNDVINRQYLNGYIISNKIISNLSFDEPNLRNRPVDIEFVKYTEIQKYKI